MSNMAQEDDRPMLFNGRRVRAWCVDAGIRQEDLADAIGIPIGTVKSWTYGQKRISFDNACRIAEYFGKSLDDLRLDIAAA